MNERDNLWAPWRMQYIREIEKKLQGNKSCIFCDKKEADDKSSHVVFRGKSSFVMLNIYPYNNGHLLFAPYAHVPDMDDLNREDVWEIFECINTYKKKIKDKMNCDGFNFGCNLGKTAGAGCEEHIHFHLVPRWNGDTNFMPIIGDTKVIPQSLEKVWEMLYEKD